MTLFAHYLINQAILDNLDKFPDKNANLRYVPSSVWGLRDTHDGRRCFWIGRGHFSDILKKAGTNDPKGMITKLADRHLIVRDSSSHCSKDIFLVAATEKCYCVLDKAIAPNSTRQRKATKKHPSRTIGSQLADLLKEDDEA